MMDIPEDIASHVLRLGRVEWGQTHAHDAEGHGAHVAESVRKTADTFGQTEGQHMHGLWLEGTETVLCHTGTSPNAPKTTQALVGAWNWLVDQAEAQRAASTALPLAQGVKLGWDADGMCDDHYRFVCKECALPLAHPAAPQESWLNDPASLEGGEPVAPQGEEGHGLTAEEIVRVSDIRRSIIRQLGGDNYADRVILDGTDWDIILAALAPAAIASGREGAE